MRYLILFLSVAFLFLHVQAQDSSGTLTITGKAAMYIVPEKIQINLNITAEDDEYNACVQKAMNKMETLKEDFKSLGVEPQEIKMQSFNINERFDWRDGERVSRGYMTNMSLQFESLYDKKFMTKLLKLLSKNSTDVNYNFSFKLSEEQKQNVKEELTKKAVDDAKKTAGYVASASGVNLKSIKAIHVGQQQDYQPIEHRQMMVEESMMKADGGGNFNFDFAPKEIPLFQSVQITWNIKQ